MEHECTLCLDPAGAGVKSGVGTHSTKEADILVFELKLFKNFENDCVTIQDYNNHMRQQFYLHQQVQV